MPKILAAVVGIELQYYSALEILKDDYDRLAAFIERHPSDSLWFAPQNCLTQEGTLLPLSQECENLCRKNLSVKNREALAHLNKTEKEALAWRWLIISHNHANPTKKVKIPNSLTLAYERKGKSKESPISAKAQEQISSLKTLVEGLKKEISTPKEGSSLPSQHACIPMDAIVQFVDNVWQMIVWMNNPGCDVKEGEARLVVKPKAAKYFADAAPKWNEVMECADELLTHQTVHPVGPPAEAASLNHLFESIEEMSFDEADVRASEMLEVDEVWGDNHPEFIEQDGLTYFRWDIELLDIAEGQSMLVTKHNGVDYHAVIGEATGPSKGIRAKGKTALRQAPIPKGPAPSKREKSPKRKESKEGKPSHPVEQENPLRVKGEPKSKALKEGQRKALRLFFKLKEDQVPADEWQAMTNAQRHQAMSERSLPKWATEAVLRSPSNLQLILEGKITKVNANSAARSPKVGMTKATSQAMEAWQQLKSDFKGTGLFKKPVTSKEKAFKKRFDQLVSDYGQQPCFPKLRERPDQQGRSPQRGRSSQRSGGSDLLDMARAMGEIARAFRGQ